MPASMTELEALFEQYEPGSTPKLRQFLTEAKYKYEVGMSEFVFKPSHGIGEFIDLRVVKAMFRLQMLTSMSKHVESLFQHRYLRELLKFPVLFLGATPEDTPAMYSLMNYADLALGTWYPMGGMHKIVEGMVKLAEELGVKIELNRTVKGFETKGKNICAVLTAEGQRYEADAVVGAGDYHHIEQEIVAPEFRRYNEAYWDKRTMAPSSLLFYLGVNKPVPNILHHNLYFDEDFSLHAEEIYKDPKWPSKPLFYVCASSKTDPTAAPQGHENLFVLIPLAPDLEDTEELREKYFDIVMSRLEGYTGMDIRAHIDYKRSFAHRDFKQDYNAYKGNAYGLANTLRQTAFLKPKLRSNKLHNLFYAGQLTTPGPGVPPSLISGRVVAEELNKIF